MKNKTTFFILLINVIIWLFANKMMSILKTELYNKGYREGMLYAYDNVLICGADPEREATNLARIMGKPRVSSINCEE